VIHRDWDKYPMMRVANATGKVQGYLAHKKQQPLGPYGRTTSRAL